MSKGWDFRDVSEILQKFRQFLLGRKHDLPTLHARFTPRLSPRSIPTPDVPRGPPELNKYYDQWYCDRNARDGVVPPIVGPIGEGSECKLLQSGLLKPSDVNFACPPTPGRPWWWDGHNYYATPPERPKTPTGPPPCQPGTR